MPTKVFFESNQQISKEFLMNRMHFRMLVLLQIALSFGCVRDACSGEKAWERTSRREPSRSMVHSCIT